VFFYSGYPGGQKVVTPAQMMAKNPIFVVEHAVKGMLPKNRLGREMFRNLHVYPGAEHPHAAQMPKTIELKK
jgi:large subunit ribosomal protein L13